MSYSVHLNCNKQTVFSSYVSTGTLCKTELASGIKFLVHTSERCRTLTCQWISTLYQFTIVNGMYNIKLHAYYVFVPLLTSAACICVFQTHQHNHQIRVHSSLQQEVKA